MMSSDSADTGTTLDSSDIDTNSSTDTETDTQPEIGSDTVSEASATSVDSTTTASTDSETSDTSTDTVTTDSTTSDTETVSAEVDSNSDNIHEDDSDTGTGEEFIPDCKIAHLKPTVLMDEFDVFFHGYFAGQCVDSVSECSGDVGFGDVYPALSPPLMESCSSGQYCCLRSCSLANTTTGEAITGWCQRPEQYCHSGSSESSAGCGDGLVCCPASQNVIHLPPCKFSNPPVGFRDDGMCILPEQRCAYGVSDQQSTCHDGLVCCPQVGG